MKLFLRLCVTFLIPMITVVNCPVRTVFAQTLAMEIKRDPVKQVNAGQRIDIVFEIEDDSGIKTVRVYFKAMEGLDYSFIVLTSENGKDFVGTLPAPVNGAGTIEYLLLVQNGNNQVVKTQNYQVAIEDDDNAENPVAENQQLRVYTELEKEPEEITGFSDAIDIDLIESSAKLGVVAGLYNAGLAGSSTSSAVAAGTVTASTGGISTTTAILGTVIAVAAVGGVAAASGGGESSTSNTGSSAILGTWNYINSNPEVSCTVSGQQVFNADGSSYATAQQVCDSGYVNNYDFTGTWRLDGTTASIYILRGPYTGTYAEGSNSFSAYSSDSGWTMYYSR